LPEEEELTPEEKVKKNHKENADFVYEGSDSFHANGTYNPETGLAVNWFMDIQSSGGSWKTGGGDDVIYHKGAGYIETWGGDDVVYLEGFDDGLGEDLKAPQQAMLWAGDDKAFGGKGSQEIWAGDGDDYIDLGEGFDIINGGDGADEFVIDLQNTGVDTILDFVDVGDKITILNGGNAAQAGDWYLAHTTEYNGMLSIGDNINASLHTSQPFIELRNADHQVAAIFGRGTDQCDVGHPEGFQLEATIDPSGIEIVSSSAQQGGGFSGSLEFV